MQEQTPKKIYLHLQQTHRHLSMIYTTTLADIEEANPQQRKV